MLFSVDDIWNKSYMNWGNEMKMKKWSSQSFSTLFSVVYWWGRREGEELHQNQPVKLTRFILLTRKAVLHSSWCSSLSVSIYNCLVFFLKAYFSKALYLFVWWSLIIGLHIMRRMLICQQKPATKLMLP